jgi:hypothetical protein
MTSIERVVGSQVAVCLDPARAQPIVIWRSTLSFAESSGHSSKAISQGKDML